MRCFFTLIQEILQLQDLRVGQVKKLGLTQEDLIENSVQDCLPYIPGLMVHATTTISLP